MESPFLVNEGKRSLVIVPAALGSRDFEIDSCRQHNFFVLFGESVDCFCALP